MIVGVRIGVTIFARQIVLPIFIFKTSNLAIHVPIFAKFIPVNFLVNHLHDLVFIEPVQIGCMSTHAHSACTLRKLVNVKIFSLQVVQIHLIMLVMVMVVVLICLLSPIFLASGPFESVSKSEQFFVV